MKLTDLATRIRSSASITRLHAYREGYESPIVLARLEVAWLRTELDELENTPNIPNRENRIANKQADIDYRLQVLAYLEEEEAA